MQVRREFLSCIGDWLLTLRERMDHEPRLMPFVMSALNDEVPEIQASSSSSSSSRRRRRT